MVGEKKPFKNWAGNVQVKNVLVYFPTRIDHIQHAIKLASVAGMKVRSRGTAHSWSRLYADENQLLINPEHLGPDEEKVVLNADKTEVTIMANVTMVEVKKRQLKDEFTILSNVIIDSR